MKLTTHRVSAKQSLGRRTLALVVSLAAGALTPAVAQALPNESNRVAIGSFRGPQASKIQDAVENALLRRYYLVPGSLVNDAARKSGVALQSAADFSTVAKRLNVQAFVTGTVIKGKTWRVQMVVRRGDTGQAVGMFDFADRKLPALASVIAKTAPRRVQAVLAVTAEPRAIAVPATMPAVEVPMPTSIIPPAPAPAPVPAPQPQQVAPAPVAVAPAVAPAAPAPATVKLAMVTPDRKSVV